MRVGETIYLDYQASTPLDPRVLKVMHDASITHFANPHAADHALGWHAAAAIEKAAAQVGTLFGLEAGDVVFTSGASEANSMAMRTACLLAERSNRTEILIGQGDHASAINEAQHCGLSVKFISLNDHGAPNVSHLRELIGSQTALVSIIGVNNENGAIADLQELSDICEQHGVLLHADLAQAPVALDVNLLDLNIPLSTVSAHKIYGPKGVGALLVDPAISSLIRPVIRGAEQQSGRRGGTLPTELIIGFGEACRLISLQGADDRKRVSAARNQFVTTLEKKINSSLVGELTHRHPGNALMHFPGQDASDLIARLQPFIAATTQSACSSGKIEPSRVIQAMGYDRTFAQECVRFSFGRYSEIDQVTDAVSIIFKAVNGEKMA